MLSSTLTQKLFCLVLGFVVALIAAFVLPYTSAIAAPGLFFDWFQSMSSLQVGLLLWDLIVVSGLGLGLPACIALLWAFRLFTISNLACTTFFVTGVLLTSYVLVPLLYKTSLSAMFVRPWWAYGMEASLILAAITALALNRWLWPNNRFNPDAIKPASVNQNVIQRGRQ